MRVIETVDCISKQLPSVVRRKGNPNEELDWLKKGIVVINGENGRGVDVFFALKKAHSDHFVLFADQRKRVAGNYMGPTVVNGLLKKAKIKPAVLDAADTVVPCLFSCMISAHTNTADLLDDCIVVSCSQSQKYHSTLWTHLASSPIVRINYDPVTYITMLFSGKDSREVAKRIIAYRQKKFWSMHDLNDFVNQLGCQVSFVPDAQERISFC